MTRRSPAAAGSRVGRTPWRLFRAGADSVWHSSLEPSPRRRYRPSLLYHWPSRLRGPFMARRPAGALPRRFCRRVVVRFRSFHRRVLLDRFRPSDRRRPVRVDDSVRRWRVGRRPCILSGARNPLRACQWNRGLGSRSPVRRRLDRRGMVARSHFNRFPLEPHGSQLGGFGFDESACRCDRRLGSHVRDHSRRIDSGGAVGRIRRFQ